MINNLTAIFLMEKRIIDEPDFAAAEALEALFDDRAIDSSPRPADTPGDRRQRHTTTICASNLGPAQLGDWVSPRGEDRLPWIRLIVLTENILDCQLSSIQFPGQPANDFLLAAATFTSQATCPADDVLPLRVIDLREVRSAPT